MADGETGSLGYPRVHLRRTDSTNERARQLAIAGAPHGTTVTADEQSAGRGRQGRSWLAPPGSALLCSLILRDPPALLSLIAGVAVCDVVDDDARVKWPNDVVLERPCPAQERGPTQGHVGSRPAFTLAKLAGILVEGRPQENWSVLGIGVNVAVSIEELPAEVRDSCGELATPSERHRAAAGRPACCTCPSACRADECCCSTRGGPSTRYAAATSPGTRTTGIAAPTRTFRKAPSSVDACRG